MENYEYIGDLGSGSYGFVWKCLQRSTGRVVAVKGFKLAHMDKKFLDQAIREVRMLRASCEHPNVVQLLEAFRSSSGRVYMVFEYVDRCLSAELHKRFTCGLPAAQTRLVLWQLLCAVAHLHSKKIIHRDIKPGNLLLTSDGVLKLCDFGFARTTRGEPYQPDRFSSYVVTRWYRSPEMLVSDLYSAASDVWSLGCTLAEIATGRPLFPGTSSLDQLWRIMRCLGSLPPSQAERFAAAATAAGLPEPPPPPPRGKSLWQRLPELDASLLEVVQACLRLDPAQRPTAAQLLQMPYFWEVPKLIGGTALERVYSEHGAAAGPGARTTSGRFGHTTAAAAAPASVMMASGAAPPPAGSAAAAASASRAFAVKVVSSEELVAPAETPPVSMGLLDGGDVRSSKRPQSVLLSSVAASLLGEPPPPPGSGSVQLVPLLVPAPPAMPAVKSLDIIPAVHLAAVAPAAAAATPPPPLPLPLPLPPSRSSGIPRGTSSAAEESPRPSSGASGGGGGGGVPGQQPPASSSPSPQPPAGSRGRSGTSPRSLPPITQTTSRRRLVSMTAMPAAASASAASAVAAGVGTGRATATSGAGVQEAMPSRGGGGAAVSAAAAAAIVSDDGVAALDRRQAGHREGVTQQRVARQVTGKRLAADQEGVSVSEPGIVMAGSGPQAAAAAAAALPAVAAGRVGGFGRVASKLSIVSPPQSKLGVEAIGASDELLLTTGGAGSDAGAAAGQARGGMALLPDGGDDDPLSDGDGHISEDDELMKYFAAKSGGSGVAAAGGGGAGGGASRRAVTVPSTLAAAAPPASAAASGDGVTAASSGGAASSASFRRLPVEGMHAGVHGAHHGLYGTNRQTSGSGVGAVAGSIGGATNRRMAAMVLRTVDLAGGCDGSGGGAAAAAAAAATGGDGDSPRAFPVKLPKRATVGSYYPVQPAGKEPAPQEATAAAATAASAAVAAGPPPGTRPRTAGVGATAASIQAHVTPRGGLPVLHHGVHGMSTATDLGLASNTPYASATYGRTSMPVGGYSPAAGPFHKCSAQTGGASRRRALSRQGSVVFNQLMYDALPEIGTPGGAPEVPAGTPPRRRVVMSGFTPCRTAAARAAAEGIPPAAAMAAVMGEAMQSTTDISVPYSPIHVGRCGDLTSPDGGEPASHCDTAGAAAATSAAMAMRRPNRRQAFPAAEHAAASASPGGPSYMNGGGGAASAAGYPTVASGDVGLVLGSSAPTFYNRMHRAQESAAAAAISSGAPAHPVAILGGAGGRIPLALGSVGGGAAGSSPGAASVSVATATPPSGGRAFPPNPVNGTARSRLASGNIARDGLVPSGNMPFPEGTASTDLDALGTWPGGASSPAHAAAAAAAAGGGSAVLTSHQLPLPPPNQQQPQQQLAMPQGGGGGVHGPQPLLRGRLGRWASGLIDSLPEDREVLHAAYGDWQGSYGDVVTEGEGVSDEAIQMLAPGASAEWAQSRDGGGGGGGGVRLPGSAASGASPPPVISPRGPSLPSNSARVPRSGSGVDPRVSGAAGAAAPPSPYVKGGSASFPRPTSPSVPQQLGGSPRGASGRSRRNLQMAAAAAAAASSGTASPPRLPGVVDAAAGAASPGLPEDTASSLDPYRGGAQPAATPPAPSRIRQLEAAAAEAAAAAAAARASAAGSDRPASTGGSEGGRERRSGGGSSGGGKWPKAKALLGGRFLSSLVRKFKETTSDK